jgi:hypothetical protein
MRSELTAATGYDDASEHLDDWAHVVQAMAERLVAIRKRSPDTVVLTEAQRRRIVEGDPALVAHSKGIATARQRISQRAVFARKFGVHLPLELLRERFELSQQDVELLAVLATIERGVAWNPYMSNSGEPLQPDVAFLIALIADQVSTAEELRLRLVVDAPLVARGFIDLIAANGWASAPPLLYMRVRLSERIAAFIDGASEPPHSVLRSVARFAAADAHRQELLLPDTDLIGQISRGIARGDQIVSVVGAPGVGRRSCIAEAAARLGRPCMTIDMHELASDPRGFESVLRPILREVQLQKAVLVLYRADEFADGEGQASAHIVLTDHLRSVRAPMALVGERTPPWASRCSRVLMTTAIPFPSAAMQLQLWMRHLPANLELAAGTSLESICKRYTATGASIVEACDELGRLDAVVGRGGAISEEQIIDVIRTRLAHRLGTLATVVRTTLEWPDVILPEEVLSPVFEFLNYAAHREQVFKQWGFDRKLPYGRGLSALFAGPPGTGKTMICSLLAKELGLELYRIDLSQVVNKYIGETEKNLGRVFDEAARGQVMLLFDEADSLFAKRTEVKSSNDRYANLLQRLESHEGVVVMTTNSETAIDPAFRRRIRFRIRFPAPDEKQRLQLWTGMMPKEANVARNVDINAIAQKYPLAGGNIMNALVRAATSAAADGTEITQEHLRRAAELEYSEMGFLT